MSKEAPVEDRLADALEKSAVDVPEGESPVIDEALYQFKRYVGNLRSDQREWNVPCKACGEYAELVWFEVVVEAMFDKHGNVIDYQLRDKAWEIGCGRDVHCICPKCGGELDRISQDGKWIPNAPEKEIEGYHISMLCSPSNSIAGMWQRFQRAIADPLRLQQFYNSELGLPYMVRT